MTRLLVTEYGDHSFHYIVVSGVWDCFAYMPNSSYKLHYIMTALGSANNKERAYILKT
jgi:hypothetical protein